MYPASLTMFADKIANQMADYVSKKYGLSNFEIRKSFDYDEKRKHDRGGVKNGIPYISIAMHKFRAPSKTKGTSNFIEYAHIKDDPDIGSLVNVPWHKALKASIAHEIAHCVQYFDGVGEAAFLEMGISSADQIAHQKHGVFWQSIYRDLRIKFVNASKPLDETKWGDAPYPKELKKRRSWYTIEYNKMGGREVIYHKRGVGKIGTLFNRWKEEVQVWDASSQSYKPTGYMTIREARKELFGLGG